MKPVVIIVSILFCYHLSAAQFAPQAGVAGSTAIQASDQQITGWATGCILSRGYMDIAQPGLGLTSLGDSTGGIGPVDHDLVSLGDSGVAILSFAKTIFNGPGPDFAVFENGFSDPGNPEEAFLELAFVEVSSDGIKYFRFPATSGTQVDSQIAGAGVYMNARKLNNLAGKYIGGYGTPFDLEELKGIPGLDVNHIVSIRLVDVVGTLGQQASVDKDNHKINDPYPTPFTTGGFDLDAVGVIHENTTGITAVAQDQSFRIYPNPVAGVLTIEAGQSTGEPVNLFITGITGNVLYTTALKDKAILSLEAYPAGLYWLQLTDRKGRKWVERITKL